MNKFFHKHKKKLIYNWIGRIDDNDIEIVFVLFHKFSTVHDFHFDAWIIKTNGQIWQKSEKKIVIGRWKIALLFGNIDDHLIQFANDNLRNQTNKFFRIFFKIFFFFCTSSTPGCLAISLKQQPSPPPITNTLLFDCKQYE